MLLLVLVHLAVRPDGAPAGRRRDVYSSQIPVPHPAGVQAGGQVPEALAAPRRGPPHFLCQGKGDLRGWDQERRHSVLRQPARQAGVLGGDRSRVLRQAGGEGADGPVRRLQEVLAQLTARPSGG